MDLSVKKVEHLSNLARIELTRKEKEKLSQELSSILGYVEQLQEVDTKNVEPISQITGLENVDRNDEVDVSDEITKKELLNNVPDKEKGFVKVKRIL